MIDKLRDKTIRFLRWSEQYTGTDMVYLFKGGGWLSFGQIISAASSFLLAIAFANLLPKEVYGSYKFILSIAGMLSVFTLQGMGTAITRAVSRGDEGAFKAAVQTRLKWGTLSALGSLGVSGYYYFNGNLELTLAFLVAAAFLPFMDTFGSYQAYLHGKKRFDLSATYDVIARIVPVILLVGAIVFSGNLFVILITYFFSYTASRLFFYWYSLKKMPPNKKGGLDVIPYGKHLSLMRVIEIIAKNIDKVLLFHFLGAAEVAIYAIAVAPTDQLRSFAKNASIVGLPKFSSRNIEEIKKTLSSRILKFAALLGVIGLLYILAAPYIFELFFPEYLEGVRISQILTFSLIGALSTILVSIFQAHERKRELYMSSTIQPVSQILLLAILVPSMGLTGAAISHVAGYTLGFLFNAYLFSRV